MNKYIPLPSQEELLNTFAYDQKTGLITRKKSGKIYTNTSPSGYITIKHKYKDYQASRLIWVMMTGEDPGVQMVDHINRDRSDNRWSNLRIATTKQNAINRSGVKGYCERERVEGKNVYTAQIKIDGRDRHLGTYKHKSHARVAYLAVKKFLFPDFCPQ